MTKTNQGSVDDPVTAQKAVEQKMNFILNNSKITKKAHKRFPPGVPTLYLQASL